MRTTLTIQDALLRKVKEASLKRNISLSEVVEDALRVALRTRAKGRRSQARRLKTFRGDGLQPGVDLKNTSRCAWAGSFGDFY